MRINKFLAQATGMSRRAADQAITKNEVKVNGLIAKLGITLAEGDQVLFGGVSYHYTLTAKRSTLVLLHKPVGYVCSRNGQGSKTIYDLLPSELHHLKPVGRLDKDSSGLLLLTDDGDLAYQYTHPKFEKEKIYEVELDKKLRVQDQEQVVKGVTLEDGTSRLKFISPQFSNFSLPTSQRYTIALSEGRNRQIRRTFAALGYEVVRLHRISFGPYRLDDLTSGKHKKIVI